MTPPRPILRVLWVLHQAVRRITGGRIGTRTAHGDQLGTLFLHTVGRKTGAPRANGLFYLVEGPAFVVVASNAGADTDPAWWLNLGAHPDAEVEIAGRRTAVRARAATGDEATGLWRRLIAANPDYAVYRATAARPIPLVILGPRGPETGQGSA